MDLISADEFFGSAESLGIGRSPEYPHSDHLVYPSGADPTRFWQVPPTTLDQTHFACAWVDAISPFGTVDLYCREWLNPLGGHGGALERTWSLLIQALGVPPNWDGALRFWREDRESLETLLFLQCALGINLLSDLLVVPSHGDCFLFFEHHAVVWVHCPDEVELAGIIQTLEHAGYPLPSELPDETFKSVSWIKAE